MAGIKKGGIKAAVKSSAPRKKSSVKSGGVNRGGGYQKASVSTPKPKSKPKRKGGWLGRGRNRTSSSAPSRQGTRTLKGVDSRSGQGRVEKGGYDKGAFKLLAKRRASMSAAGQGGNGVSSNQDAFTKPNPSSFKPLSSKFKIYSQAKDKDNSLR